MNLSQNMRSGSISAEQVKVKNILKNTYLWMSFGLAITGLIAFFSAESGFSENLLKRSPYAMLIAILIELGLVFYLSARIMKMSADRAAFVFLLYSALNGFTLSTVFLAYTKTSIYRRFLLQREPLLA